MLSKQLFVEAIRKSSALAKLCVELKIKSILTPETTPAVTPVAFTGSMFEAGLKTETGQ